MSTVDEIVDGFAEAWDELRPELFQRNGVDATCQLLQKNLETNEYILLLELTSGWFFEDEAYRAQKSLKVARMDSQFVSAFDLMTDFAINGLVYTIDEPNRDKQPPQGNQFYYKAFGTINGDVVDSGQLNGSSQVQHWSEVHW